MSRKLFSIYRYKISNMTKAEKQQQLNAAVIVTEEDQ